MKFATATPVPANGRLKTIALGTAEVFKLDPRIISREEGFNARFDFGDIPGLADGIEANLIASGPSALPVLKVRKEGNRILLVDGDRSLTAVELLMEENRWPEDPKNPGFPLPVPCTSEGSNITPVDRIFMMLALNNGKQFNMLEKAIAYQDILSKDPTLNDSDIARRTGDTKQAVSNALILIRNASPGLIDLIKAGRISSTTALDIVRDHKEDHPAQDAAATAAIATAEGKGRQNALPKDLPKKKAPKAKACWSISEVEHEWNEDGVCTTPSTVTAQGGKWGIREFVIRYARHEGKCYGGMSLAFTSGLTSKPVCYMRGDKEFTSCDDAILAQWISAHQIIAKYADQHKDKSKILAWLDELGTDLQATFSASKDSEPAASASDPAPSDENRIGATSDGAYFADLSDGDSDEETVQDLGTANPDAPADPGAIARIKAADSSGGGGGGGGSFGSSNEKMEGRIKKINDLLNELNKDNCHNDRWDSMELLLDYLEGNHTITTIKKHLTKA